MFHKYHFRELALFSRSWCFSFEMWNLLEFIRIGFLTSIILFVNVCSQTHDGIITPLASGSSIVESVCSLIESTCIFPDDKLFMRRLAYDESTDGTNSNTFRTGYYGGIWQVTMIIRNCLLMHYIQRRADRDMRARMILDRCYSCTSC